DASYLINARNTNGTPSIVTLSEVPVAPQFAGRLVNSVPDAWTAQVGITLPLPHASEHQRLKGLQYRIVGRAEGIPTHDLIGRSGGFRQPGYIMSVGPGLSYQHGKNLWTVDVPIICIKYINPVPDLVPYLEKTNGRITSGFNPNENLGLVAPVAVLLRYT